MAGVKMISPTKRLVRFLDHRRKLLKRRTRNAVEEAATIWVEIEEKRRGTEKQATRLLAARLTRNARQNC
ncbi:hypothetical protein [Methylorubrum extorquens]|uniref:Uncharacterized protein n=1 Tax=Methylorubrum extorquens (strain CM4 / NCIMB 13688) TaxID=440085 RepID=B7KWK4_METC4|nr:hypothetical protein [Methylorubrum extorquens]ACK86081.1 hypothetical protein Mchl_5320 [Methylorubrum extorquens CM4]